MKLKHTPGPWRRQGAIIWGAEIQREVARVKTQPGEPFQDNANAKLIAAAPELLEAAKLAIEQIEFAHKPKLVHEPEYVLRLLREAIAKAEGIVK